MAQKEALKSFFIKHLLTNLYKHSQEIESFHRLF